MGYDFTGGRIFDFCIDFSMGLTTVQRYCAACDFCTAVSSLPKINLYRNAVILTASNNDVIRRHCLVMFAN